MSIAAVKWAKCQKAGGSAAKVVLLILAEYADDDGRCWPSQATIADEAELSDRSVRDQLTKLEAAGLIEREEHRRRDGTQAADRIRLIISRNDVPADSRNVVPIQRQEVPPDSRKDVPQQPEGRSALTTFEPPLEPPIEKKAGADELAERLWQAANQTSRDRSGRPATRKATAAALGKGATPDALERTIREHCGKAGDYAKGVHRIIEGEHWREHLPKPAKPLTSADLAARQRHFRDTGEWKPEWGERPRDAA